MNKLMAVFFCVAIAATSCLKNDSKNSCPYSPSSITIPAAEQTAIDTYIDTSNIEAVKDPRGFYYQIVSAGTSTDSVKLCSQIQITYTGKLVNDTTFDSQTNAVFVLGSLIEGWRMGIPLLKKGGEIKLYIPPTLGYGSKDIVNQTTGKVVIPKNSIIKFDVKLTDYTLGN